MGVRSPPARSAMRSPRGRLDDAAALSAFHGSCPVRSSTATSAGASSAFRPPTCVSTPRAGYATASMRCASLSADAATMVSRTSAGGRCSIPAPCCSKSFCSILPATFTASASMSPSSTGSATSRSSVRSTNLCADQGRRPRRARHAAARRGCFPADLAGGLTAVLGRRSRRSRAHCAARKPSKATGTMRCQPSARPACMATPRIFGSSSHDDACARAARSRIARSLARRRATAPTIAPIAATSDEDAGHHQPGDDIAQLQRQPVVGGDTEEDECRQRCDHDNPRPKRGGRRSTPLLAWIASVMSCIQLLSMAPRDPLGAAALTTPSPRRRRYRRHVAPKRNARPATIASVV